MLPVAESNSNTLVEVYLKPTPLAKNEDPYFNTSEELSFRHNHLTFGPFHSLLDPVPAEATKKIQINSLFLNLILKNYEEIVEPLQYKTPPPRSNDFKEISKAIKEWKKVYPHILHGVYFPAAAFVQSQDSLALMEWYELSIQLPLNEDALLRWCEIVVYAKLLCSLRASYKSWTRCSMNWLIDVEFEERSKVYEKELKEYVANKYPISPYMSPKKSTPEFWLRTSREITRFVEYVVYPPFDQYLPPSPPAPKRSIITSFYLPCLHC